MGTGYTRADVSNNIADGNIINASDLDSEFDAVQAAFDAATGHTHDGTTAEGAPIEVTGPAQEYVSTNTEFRPKANNTYDLGSAANQWKDLYVDGTANLDAVDIDGGNIDGTTIGASTAAAGTFTTATATTGNITTVNATTVDTTNIEVTNIKAKDGTAAGSIADATGVVTLASSVLTTTDINGGTIDGATIGGSSAAAGTFTTATATTGNITTVNATTVDSTNVEVTNIKAKDGTASATIADSTGVMTVASSVLTTTDINGGTIDGVTLGTNSAVTEAQIDNININGNAIISTNTNGNIALTPNGTGEVDISKVDIDGGTIDGTVIGGSTPAAISGTTITATGDVDIADKIVHTGDTNTAIRFPAADTVTVETAGAERVRVDSSGRVGIGTTSPNGRLQVTGGTTNASNLATAYSAAAFTLVPKSTSGFSLAFGSGPSDFPYIQMSAAGTVASDMSLQPYGGNVGIGTSSISGKFSVDGSMYAGPGSVSGVAYGFYPASTYGNTGMFSPAANTVAFATTGGERVRIDSSGNVGIGSSNPSAKLQVGTTINSTALILDGTNYSAGGQQVRVDFTNGGSTHVYSRIANETAAAPWSGEIVLATNPGTSQGSALVERMRIDSSGNVGVGTSSPAVQLHATGVGRFSQLQMPNSAGTYTSGSAGFHLFGFSDDNLYFNWFDAGAIVFRNNGSNERMRIDSSGNVGIGTSSPSNFGGANLQVQNSTIASVLWTDGTHTGQLLASASAEVSIGSRSNHPLRFGTNDTERMRIDSSGNLLVGTTSAGARLDVKGAGNTSGTFSIKVANSDGTIGLQIREDGYVGSPMIYANTNANAANVVVTSDGYIYRSTSSLKYKKNVQDADFGLSELLNLRPVTYQGKSGSDTEQVFGGLIAEEVHDAGLTEFVQYADDGTPDALAYGHMVALCIKAIQEQQAIIEDLKARVAALEA